MGRQFVRAKEIVPRRFSIAALESRKRRSAANLCGGADGRGVQRAVRGLAAGNAMRLSHDL